MASQCASPGLSKNWENGAAATVMSGRVATEAYIRLPMASQQDTAHMRKVPYREAMAA